EACRCGVQRAGCQRETRLRQLSAGFEVDIPNTRRLLELPQQRRRAANRCRPLAPAPRRARHVDERREMVAEERVEYAAKTEHATEILQWRIARAVWIDWIAPLHELAALAQHQLRVAARKI